MGQQHVEVPLGDVRAGVADLVGAPAALERAEDLARRAGVDPDRVRSNRARRAPGTPRGPRGVGWPSARTATGTAMPAGASCRLQPARVLGEPARGRRRTGASRAAAPAPRRRSPAIVQPPVDEPRGPSHPPRGRGVPGTRRGPPGARQARGVRVGGGLAAVQRSGPSSTATPMASSMRREARATSTIAASNASLLRADGSR